MVPSAVFALLVVPLLALALVPQATLLPLPAAVARAAPCGSDPSVLPPQTNCACAGGAPMVQASTTVAAVATEKTNDNRLAFITRPRPTKIFGISGSTPAATPECRAVNLPLSCFDIPAPVARATLYLLEDLSSQHLEVNNTHLEGRHCEQ
jgi:hypothetical protein